MAKTTATAAMTTEAGIAAWKVQRASEGTQARHDYNTGVGSHHWVDFVYAFGKLIDLNERRIAYRLCYV